MSEAPQPKPRPVPAPRKKLLKKTLPAEDSPPEWRMLLASTEVFQRGEVKNQTIPAEVESAAKAYLKVKPQMEYHHIDLKKLTRDNQEKNDCLKKIATALEKLFHYAVNLLSPVRPRAWRTIKFATPFYHIHVNPVVGAKNLLRELGYRRETERSLEFYEDTVPESDIPKVKQITAELLVAKLEMEGFDQEGLTPWQLLQPPHANAAPRPVDMFGEDSLRVHGSDVQTSSAHTLPQGGYTFDTLTAQPHIGTAEPYKRAVLGAGDSPLPESIAEYHAMPEWTAGASPPTEQEPAAMPNSDSEDDEKYLEMLKIRRTQALKAVKDPGKQEAPKATPIPSQLAPPDFPTVPESKPEEDRYEDYHTPAGSPTSTGRLSPPLIPLHSSPGERLIPEGQSNVFPQSMPRHQSADATAAQAGPQAAARVSRPTTITPHTVKANESLGGEDSFVMIDRHEAVGVRAEEERRRETDEKKAAEGHSVDLALKDYVVVDLDYNEMKEKARKEHETKKSKMAAVEDIEQRTKEEMKRRFAEEEMKSGTKEGGVQHKNRIEAQKRKLKSDGEFFMTWLKHAMRFGYVPEEVEFAVHHYDGQYKTPLDFLHREWHERKKMVQNHIGRHTRERGMADVGIPSFIEARDCLVECAGNINEAIALCAHRREEKINELLRRYPAERSEAARVLSMYKLNVDVAVRELERESLKGIMEFIWEQVDQDEIRKKEGDRLAELVKQKKDTHNDFCHRLLMAEFNLEDWGRAELVFNLMAVDVEFSSCLKVAKNCRTMEEAEKFMNQECPVCCDSYCMDEMVAMLHCQCSVCKECFCTHYTMMAQEKNIAHFNCLVCAQPDLSATDIDKDDYLMLFAALLKENVPSDQYQLFQKKATEFSLLKDPNFRWCAHTECGAGFIHDPPLNKVIQCPYCRYKMCFGCKRPWEDQHKGISCNDFTKWKAENDEGNQQKGLAAFLKENGIECPNCHCRYDLARGGCLHFKCGQCPTDFCGGCGAVYDKACRKYKSCANKGFHAHHPRDCLFYLRDWPVESLQKLLNDKKVEFDTEAPEAQVNAARQAAGADQGGEAVGGAAEKEEPKASMAVGQLVLRCRVMLQKEIGTERVDEECGDDCKQGHGGLCEKHYKEYLIFKVNEAKLDPADNMEVDELRAVIMREEKAIPEGDEKDAQYKERLKEQLKKDLPLEHRGGLNF